MNRHRELEFRFWIISFYASYETFGLFLIEFYFASNFPRWVSMCFNNALRHIYSLWAGEYSSGNSFTWSYLQAFDYFIINWIWSFATDKCASLLCSLSSSLHSVNNFSQFVPRCLTILPKWWKRNLFII